MEPKLKPIATKYKAMGNPWEVEGVPWKTEASYWSWVRGVLRKGWSRHPVKLEYIKKHRKQVPNPNPNGKKATVWGMTCACCGGDFALSIPTKTKKHIKEKLGIDIITIEINHKTAASSLKCKEDLGDFAQRLFYVTFDDLEPLCKNCHDIYTYMDRWGITFEEAVLEKKVINISKREDLKSWLVSAFGFTENEVSNKTKRSNLVRHLLETKQI